MLVLKTYMTEQMQIRVAGLEKSFPILNEQIEDKDGNMTYLNDMTTGLFDVRIKLTPLTALTPEAKLVRAMQLFTQPNPQGMTIYDIDAVAKDSEDANIHQSAKRQKRAAAQREEREMKMRQQEMANKQGGAK